MSRNYLEALIIMLVTAALGYFLVWPQSGELADIKQKIEEKNAEIKNQQDYYENLEKIAVELDQRAEALSKVDTAFPDGQDAAPLLNFLQTAAMQSGLIFKKVDYTGKTTIDSVNLASDEATGAALSEKPSPQSYEVTVELLGSYPNFKDFLSRVERSSRLADINLVSVSSKDAIADAKEETTPKTAKQNPSDIALNYTIKLTADYYQPPRKPLSANDNL